MDGYKVRAKLALSFPRPVGNAEAEDVMMQYARAFAAAVECELSNGDLPFEEHEIHQRITDAVQALPKKNVKIIGLHVWHKGAVSSGSMLAVTGPESKATVPAMAAVSTSQTREKAPAQTPAHTATTLKPAARSQTPSAGVSAPPSSARGAVTMPAPDPARAAASHASRPAVEAPGATSAARPAVSTPAPTSGARVSAQPHTAPRGTPTVVMPAVVQAAATQSAAVQSPPSSAQSGAVARATSASMPGAPRGMSGVVAAVEPRILRSKSGFLVALEQTSAESGDDVGKAMAQPIRDAAAGLLLATLDALHGSIQDPLSFFDGRADATLRQGLIGEACVCVCYVLYESLTRTSLPQMQGIQVVQHACVHALSDKNMPVSEISRYLATESPREEFTARVCTLLGARETPELQQRVDAGLRSLRVDVKACAEQIEARLGRAKAAGGR